MSTLTKEWLLKTIAELEEERDAVPGAVNEDAAMALAAMKLALASLEAEAAIHRWRRVTSEPYGPYPWHYGNFIGFSNPVDDLEDEYFYSAPPAPVSVPDEVLKRLLPDAEKAEFWFEHDGKILFEGVKFNNAVFEACRAAMLQGAEPVSNRDELKDGWVACSERMPEETGDIIVVSDGIVMSGISYSRKKGFYLQALEYDADETVDDVTHWMPLPAAPQQEAE